MAIRAQVRHRTEVIHRYPHAQQHDGHQTNHEWDPIAGHDPDGKQCDLEDIHDAADYQHRAMNPLESGFPTRHECRIGERMQVGAVAIIDPPEGLAQRIERA